jgi:acetolactate synthase-1/2/3 large subunit
VVAKHEGAAANMAEADGKLTGRPGICFVTRARAPPRQHRRAHGVSRLDADDPVHRAGTARRAGREAFQEVEFRQMFAPLAKWVAEVESADRIPEYVLRAFQVATSGRPGPVVLSLPEDVLGEQSAACDTRPYQRGQAAPHDRDLAAVRRAEERIEAAAHRRRLVWSDADCAALTRFAEANALPVLASFRGRISSTTGTRATRDISASGYRRSCSSVSSRGSDHRARLAPGRRHDDDVFAAEAAADRGAARSRAS